MVITGADLSGMVEMIMEEVEREGESMGSLLI